MSYNRIFLKLFVYMALIIFCLSSKGVSEGISYQFDNISNTVLNFVLREDGKQRWEVPKQEPFPFHGTFTPAENPDYIFEVEQSPFSITVKRKTNNEILFSTKNFNTIFKENYTELTTSLPSKYIFGFGERTTSFLLQPGLYTIYNRDAYGVVDDGKGAGNNRYGHHPMYLMREKSGNYHIVFLRNTLPMDVIISQSGDNYELTYKIVGGVLDFSIFLGDTNPETVVKQYQKFLGGHTMPPFWSLGFHQCRWGYQNLDMIHEVMQKYQENKLPLDTIWMDIDYMQDYVPFTVDETRYNLTDFRNYLKRYRKKFVMIAEPAMSIKWPDYEYLVKGKELDLFIKNKEGQYLINRVWPGDCYFIDYFHPNTPNYWMDALDKLHDKIDFSGVWLDMNEVATFEPGQVDINDQRISCNDDTVYPYLPSNQPLERNTICPNAKHFNNYTHAEVHNYNPVMQQMLTHKFLEKKFPDQFPFILSRANSAGTGKWSFHWTGDNVSSQTFYQMSVSEVMNNNMFGIPMVGADICGFATNAEENLCAKFYQMGSLFPFSRSHAANDTNRKEPYAMGKTLLNTVKKSLNFRYQILKYYYSLFMRNNNTGTVFRPVFFNFFDDMELINNVNLLNSQFMIGEDLLVVPNFNSNTETVVNGYFPSTAWYDLRYNVKIPKVGYQNIEAPLEEMPPVFLRGGKTIFTNNVEYVENSYDLTSDFNFLISFDPNMGDSMTSTGKIPALLQYYSRQKVTECMTKNCMIDIISNYDKKNKMLNINFSDSNYYGKDYTYITALSFKIYGLNIKGLGVASTNLNDLIEDLPGKKNKFLTQLLMGREKFALEYINDNFFTININGILKIKIQKLNIVIQFK